MRKKNLFDYLEALHDYNGEQFGLFIVSDGERIAAGTNRANLAANMLGVLFTSNEGCQMFRDMLEFIRDDMGEESLTPMAQIIREELGDELGISFGVHANELCKNCRRFEEKACGFGHCAFLDRDVDGEESNAANTLETNGCGKFYRR